MKKINGVKGVINAIQLVLKYAGYITIVIEIANFAISKINPLLPAERPNETILSTDLEPSTNA